MPLNGVWKPCGAYDVLIGRVAEEIRLTTSDGDIARWPGNDGRRSTRRVVTDADTVSYYEPCTEPKRLKHWYKILGKFLAEEVVVKDGVKVRPDTCTLHAFPEGYKLFLWKHGDKDTPRIDTYLCGSPNADFRSPAEFLLHAKWLAQGCPMKQGRSACGCKYCAKTKQHAITRQYIRHHPYPGRQAEEGERADTKEAQERREARKREREREERPIMAKDYRVWNGDPMTM